MVSFTSVATALFAVVATMAQASTEVTLKVGDYYRPTGWIVSGEVNATTAYRRSPCPALNTLANHGYLARTGKGITRGELKAAIMKHFNLDDGLATTVSNIAPEKFDLNFLSTHSLIEHDASLAHVDSYFKTDPASTSSLLLADMYARVKYTQKFDINTMGQIRRDRLTLCKKTNPQCLFGDSEIFFAFGEAVFLLKLFGDYDSNTASLARVKSFMEHEMFPAGYTAPKTALSLAALTEVSAKIQAVANAA